MGPAAVRKTKVNVSRGNLGPSQINSRSETGEIAGWINRGRAFAQLEMELRRGHISRLTGFGDRLPALHGFSAFDRNFAIVGIG